MSIDEQVLTWAKSVLGEDTAYFLEAPTPDRIGVTLYLMRMSATPPLRGTKRPPLQVKLHYLLVVQGTDIAKAHEQISELLFAAMANLDFEVLLDGISEALWQSYGLPPQPAFILTTILHRLQAEPETKPILQPLQTEFSLKHSFSVIDEDT